jgi:hypothetical protein
MKVKFEVTYDLEFSHMIGYKGGIKRIEKELIDTKLVGTVKEIHPVDRHSNLYAYHFFVSNVKRVI